MPRLLPLATAILMCSCSGQTPSPVAPQSAIAPSSGDDLVTPNATTSDTHGHRLTAVSGFGTGIVNITATAKPIPGVDRDQGFALEGVVNVHGAPPNTTFLVERNPDSNVNGVCEGAGFITVPIPRPGPLVTLTTSPGGAGATHFSVEFPDSRTRGVQFDVMFRVLESSPNPGATELRTECFTVTVK